jgi:uncharacterized protein (UPF0548 family)
VTGPRRSSSFGADSSLNYASIGATQNPDVVLFPPKGFRTFQQSHRIGSGATRFEIASRTLMTWGVHRNSGIPVVDISREAADLTYKGIEFDGSGRPVGPADPPAEDLFAPDGTPYVSAGMTAVMIFPIGPFKVRAPVKVVYTIDEPDRVGFAYGTRHGHPSKAEQLQYVEREQDGSVWLTIRSISAPSSGRFRLTTTLLRATQKRYARRFLTALHPTRSPNG